MRQYLILAASACALAVTALPAAAQEYNNPPQANPQPAAPAAPIGRAVDDAGPNYQGTQQNTENTQAAPTTRPATRPMTRQRTAQRTRRAVQPYRLTENTAGGEPGNAGGYAPGYGYSNYYNYAPGFGGYYNGGYYNYAPGFGGYSDYYNYAPYGDYYADYSSGGPGFGDFYNYAPGYVLAAATPAGGTTAWCEAHFRSFNPATGTYLGFDGMRHACP